MLVSNLLFIVWDVDPRIIPSFEFLRWYSLAWALGVLAAYQITVIIFRKENIPLEQLDRLSMYVILGVILGARLGHVLFYDPAYYWRNPIELLPFKVNPHFEFTGFEGLASHGGILGASLALYFVHRKYSIGYMWALDRLIIAGALLGGFIRVGNLMNSEIIGKPSQMPWAFVFTRIDQVPRHPAQLYEAIFYFFVALVLFFVWKSGKTEKYQGFLVGLGLTLIFIQRFIVEFMKENQVPFESGMLINMGQLLSIPVVLLGMILMVRSLVKGARHGI